MSKTKTKSSTNAVTNLKADHQNVKGLFDEFEKNGGAGNQDHDRE